MVTDRSFPGAAFWRGRRVLLTGHTGFKGAWAALWLSRLGARVHGLALAPETEPSLWLELGDGLLEGETRADIAELEAVREAVARAKPQIVLHMAAQALVGRGYANPIGTVRTNTLGTVNLLDALSGADGLKAALIVTTDKVYANDDTGTAFAETDRLGGDDPYSASKSAAEILTHCYARTFFDPAGVPVATARAGNVIGGGNWSADRLVPDVWRAAVAGVPLRLRSPQATRPWQHVLEVLSGYFAYVQRLAEGQSVPRALNFGPGPGGTLTVAELAEAVGRALGLDHPWERDCAQHPPEATLLSLDSSRARAALGWQPRLDVHETVEWTARWYADHRKGKSARSLCLGQISAYEDRL